MQQAKEMKRLTNGGKVMKLASIMRAAALAGLFACGSAMAGEVNTGYFGNVAIEGYDTVAYFTDGKPLQGSDAHAYDWLGATWLFASDEHRKLFAASPISYAPQYGGFCADGVSDGKGHAQVNIEPTTWQIVNGKLYLAASAEFANPPLPRDKGDQNWKRIEAELLTQ
jgi:YHS domain-containing protein